MDDTGLLVSLHAHGASGFPVAHHLRLPDGNPVAWLSVGSLDIYFSASLPATPEQHLSEAVAEIDKLVEELQALRSECLAELAK